MLNVAVPRRDGSPVASVVVSEDVDTPRLCHPALVALDSTHHLGQVGMEADSVVASGAEVEVASVVVSVVVIASVVLVVALDTKATVMDSADKLPPMPRLVLAVDAAEVSEEGTVAVIVVVAGLTVVLLAAIRSLCGLETAMLTVTAAIMTAMTVTEIAIVTAWETAMETDTETVIVNVTGMAVVAVAGMVAERSTDASETAKMSLDMMTLAPGEDTKHMLSRILSFLPSVLVCWWVPLSLICPVL